jgi:hypothetical protein
MNEYVVFEHHKITCILRIYGYEFEGTFRACSLC